MIGLLIVSQAVIWKVQIRLLLVNNTNLSYEDKMLSVKIECVLVVIVT